MHFGRSIKRREKRKIDKKVKRLKKIDRRKEGDKGPDTQTSDTAVLNTEDVPGLSSMVHIGIRV